VKFFSVTWRRPDGRVSTDVIEAETILDVLDDVYGAIPNDSEIVAIILVG
jgi:hypothetical protein